jgi:hypothetical protein
VVGLDQIAKSHALAHHKHPGFEIVGLVNCSAPDLRIRTKLNKNEMARSFHN